MMYDPAKADLAAQLTYHVAVNTALIGVPRMTGDELRAMEWAFRSDIPPEDFAAALVLTRQREAA